jgi:hypothetical protein
MQFMLYPTYSSALDTRSAIYAREVCLLSTYLYEALLFNVSMTGDYTFWSHSDINTYGYLYRDDFNPFQPVMNRLAADDDRCHNKQFSIVHRLLPNTRYILVVTSAGVNATGRFSVMSAGPTAVRFIRLGQSNHADKDTRSQRCECQPIMECHFE